MFKNIQKYLLINQPLLWNTKIVPLSVLLIIINIGFFALGYNNGAVDFTETNNNYRFDTTQPTLIFMGLLISIIILILWLVFYFKNNSFKSFYPKNNFSLFKEWAIIFLGVFMIAMFAISYFYAKEVRVRNYFTEAEAKKRCETLSLASIFIDGSFEEKYYYIPSQVGDSIRVAYDYSEFKGKKYSTTSLMNKNIETFEFFDTTIDSLNKLKVRNWLYNNQKSEVQKLFKDYLAIANDHHLETNINENQWLDLVYNYPDFKEINIVGRYAFRDKTAYYEDYAEEIAVADTTSTGKPIDNFDYVNKYKKMYNGEEVVFFKHYVPASNLNYAYEKIANAWISPDITFVSILFPLYFALGFSMLIFSFRITSGRNWLISLVSLGVVNIIFGILSAICSTEVLYLTAIAILTLLLFVYFIYIINRKKGKSISAITLNGLLWLFGGFIPLIYTLFVEYLEWRYDYRNYAYFAMDADRVPIPIQNKEMFDFIEILKDNYITMAAINVVFIFVFMFFISIQIKKWKGIAED